MLTRSVTTRWSRLSRIEHDTATHEYEKQNALVETRPARCSGRYVPEGGMWAVAPEGVEREAWAGDVRRVSAGENCQTVLISERRVSGR